MNRRLLVAAFGSVLLNLSTTTVNVAVDQLMDAFHAPLATVQWIITGYLLALTLVLPVFRAIVERVGSRRLYVWCLAAFSATSVLSAAAWSAPTLIASRVLAGAVGGLLAPLAQTLLAEIAGPKRMGHAVAVMSIPALLAPILGPVIGGIVIQWLSWRWLFLVNLPLGVAGAVIAWRVLPAGGPRPAAPARLDVFGLALLSPGIGLFTWGLAALGHAKSASSSSLYALEALGGAAVLVTVFIVDARRRPHSALLDLRLFRNKAVVAAFIAYLSTSFGSFGAQLVLPLYFEQVRGASPFWAGALMAPQGIGMLLTLPKVGKLTDRFDPGYVVIGGVLTTLAGTLVFCFPSEHVPLWLLCASLVVRGAGLGATTSPTLAAAYKNIERAEIPNATTAINIVQRLGAPLGTAALAMVLAQLAHRAVGASLRSPSLLAPAFAHTFAIAAILAAPTLLAGWLLVRASAATRH